MENKAKIFSDPYSVTLSAEFISPALKVILILFYAIIIGFVIFILSLFEGEGGPKSFLLPAIGLGVLLFTSGRYVAWNFFGKEIITVSTKSISYYRDYGITKTTPKVILFKYLATNTTIEKQEGDRMYGLLHFFDRNETTMQLKSIFSSAINLPIELIKEMEQAVHLLPNHDNDILEVVLSPN